MHLVTRNVNTAFYALVDCFATAQRSGGVAVYNGETPVVKRNSRNGPVLVIDEPVTVTYEKPRERVLFNTARDCNPFFHLYESMWMLAGERSVAPLVYYNSKMKDYSDNWREVEPGVWDGTLNGSAYGWRWRKAQGAPNLWTRPGSDGKHTVRGYDRKPVDQLKVLIEHLKQDPDSRRAVLQMWSVEQDLAGVGVAPCTRCEGEGMLVRLKDTVAGGKVVGSVVTGAQECEACKGSGLGSGKLSKDLACNLCVMFSLREVDGVCPTCNGEWTVAKAVALDEAPPPATCPNCSGAPTKPFVKPRALDITVINRSNDLVWGMLGANYVQFSMLQEYMACALGVEVGRYHHVSNNLHAYEWNWKPKEWLDYYDFENYAKCGPYDHPGLTRGPLLVKNVKAFDHEVKLLVAHNGRQRSRLDIDVLLMGELTEPFLATVAQPMCAAWHAHKAQDYTAALHYVDQVAAADWRKAGKAWMQKRAAKAANKG